MIGILDFDEGDILIDNKSIKTNTIECKKIMSYVPDNPDMYENMKAIDFINFVCDMYETPYEIRKNNIDKYAKMFELTDKLNNRKFKDKEHSYSNDDVNYCRFNSRSF